MNTVSFNGDGDVLVSGSDDKKVIFWDWENGNVKLSFHSGHDDNIFQAKIMPGTDDRSIVTCAADGQVFFGDRMNIFFLYLNHNSDVKGLPAENKLD